MTFTFPDPSGWRRLHRWGDGWAYREERGGLRVLIDCERKADGNEWIHVSYSRKDWTPSHADTCKVKRAFLGDRYAYAVFPPQATYVNIHDNCLHLWARIDDGDGRVLPEFSAVLTGVGLSI